MSKESFKIETKRGLHRFEILGKEFYVDSSNVTVSDVTMISLINVLGRTYWDEMKKQGIIVSKNLFEFLQYELCDIPYPIKNKDTCEK